MVLNPEYLEAKKALKQIEEEISLMNKMNQPWKTMHGKSFPQGWVPEIHNKLNAYLKEAKATRDNLNKIPEKLKMIVVESNKEYKFFPESINEEFGLTQYDRANPITLKVKKEFEYSKVDKSVVGMAKDLKDQALVELRALRANRRAIQFVEKEFPVQGLPIKPKYKVYVGGGYGIGNGNHVLHMEPGTFMKLKEAAKLREVFKAKKPLTNVHHVGVEIEFISKKDKYFLAQKLVENNISKFVELKDDGSLRADESTGHKYTHELCIVAPESVIHEVLRLAINAIDQSEGKVDKKCGLHIHLDMRSREYKTSFNNLVKSQEILYGMNPARRVKSEEGTSYSKKISIADFDEALRNHTGDRYLGINMNAYSKYQTIEVRLHSGSTNFTKISNWIKILVAIVSDTTKHDTVNHKVETFVERYGLNDEMLAYIKERTMKFKDTSGKHITLEEAS